MVMPRSRSRSFESMTRVPICWCAAKVPDCCKSLSTSVVVPWSTWAMMAMLRSLWIIKISGSYDLYDYQPQRTQRTRRELKTNKNSLRSLCSLWLDFIFQSWRAYARTCSLWAKRPRIIHGERLNAECGVVQGAVYAGLFRIPHSEFRISVPGGHGGGAVQAGKQLFRVNPVIFVVAATELAVHLHRPP